MAAILVVDDHERILEMLTEVLSLRGHRVYIATDIGSAIQTVQHISIDVALVDLMFENMPIGLDILAGIVEIAPDVVVIMLTAHATTPTTIEAVQRGAIDYLEKKDLLKLPVVYGKIEKALRKRRERIVSQGSSPELIQPLDARQHSKRLPGTEFEQLSTALRDAFNLQMFDEMLRIRLEKSREDIALGKDFGEIIYRTITRAEKEGWINQLVLAARESNPGNPVLLDLAAQLGLAPTNTPGRATLERIIDEANSFLDVSIWRERLGKIETQVCRVEIQGNFYGTGFLVSPDVVMTNYHVIETVIQGENEHKPADVTVRFDYKRLSNNTILNPGSEYRLREPDWLIDYSPYDPVDLHPAPKQAVPKLNRLDYALLRLGTAIGNLPVGPAYGPQDQRRGWIRILTEPYDFTINPALFIVQYPKGEPMKLALDTQAVLAVNQNGTRITYRTNTEPGSSGSPCFNQDWELVALHHGGDPRLTPAWNEGIPTAAIADLLREKGLLHIITR